VLHFRNDAQLPRLGRNFSPLRSHSRAKYLIGINADTSARHKEMPRVEFAVMTRSTTLEAMLKALAAMMVLLPFAALGLYIVLMFFL